MPVTFVIATLAALSMAGIPLLNGFLSKEMMLEEANHTALFNSPWLVPALATFGSLFSAAYCFRLIGHVFFGPVRDDYPAKPHDPGAGLWMPPAILVVLGCRDWRRAVPRRTLCKARHRVRSGRARRCAEGAFQNLAWAGACALSCRSSLWLAAC